MRSFTFIWDHWEKQTVMLLDCPPTSRRGLPSRSPFVQGTGSRQPVAPPGMTASRSVREHASRPVLNSIPSSCPSRATDYLTSVFTEFPSSRRQNKFVWPTMNGMGRASGAGRTECSLDLSSWLQRKMKNNKLLPAVYSRQLDQAGTLMETPGYAFPHCSLGFNQHRS